MMSMHSVVLALLAVSFFLVTPSVAQIQNQTRNSPASSSGRTDQQGWAVPFWWRQYRMQLGTFVSVSVSVSVRVSRRGFDIAGRLPWGA